MCVLGVWGVDDNIQLQKHKFLDKILSRMLNDNKNIELQKHTRY